MNTRLGILSIILAMSIFLIFELKNFPVANADISNNNNNPDNSFKLKIPLPFSSHIADKTIEDKKHYIDNILPFP
jgi:hypothetical protein